MKKLSIISVSALLILSIVLTNFAQAQEQACNTSELTSQEYAEIQRDAQTANYYDSYLIKKDGHYIANTQKMLKDGLPIKTQIEIREYSTAKSELTADINNYTSYKKAVKKMWYGRYCGKGNIGGKPIDALDSACKAHDNCYAKKGWGSCACDATFIRATNKIVKNKKYSVYMRKKAKQARLLFAGAYIASCR